MREETLFGIFAAASIIIVYLVIIVVMIASSWKIHEKAGKPGWTAIIPIYNTIILLEIAGKPVWWIVLFMIPIANIIAPVMVNLEVAKKFGLSPGFGIGMSFLPLIFMPILAFGPAKFEAEDKTNIDHFIA
jgi:hypothetical protein